MRKPITSIPPSGGYTSQPILGKQSPAPPTFMYGAPVGFKPIFPNPFGRLPILSWRKRVLPRGLTGHQGYQGLIPPTM